MRSSLRALVVALLLASSFPLRAALPDPPAPDASPSAQFEPGPDVLRAPGKPVAPPSGGDTGGSWSRIIPASISGRAFHSMILDAPGDRLVLYGGVNRSQVFTDVWTRPLAAGSWTRLDVTPGPSKRAGQVAVFDPVRRRMIVFGGHDSNSFFDDTWALSLSGTPSWQQIPTNGVRPPGRTAAAAVYDPVRDRLIVFAGWNEMSLREHDLGDTWALSLSGTPTWTRIGVDAPIIAGVGVPIGGGFQAIYDPAGDRVLVPARGSNHVWGLELSADPPRWALITPTGDPSVTSGAAATATYDASRNRMLLTGVLSDGTLDVFALTLTGAPAWQRIRASSESPTGRLGHAAAYSPADDRLIVFGGWDAGGSNPSYRSDTWAFSLAEPAWAQVEQEVPSPREGRYGHSAVFDAPRNRMIIFGGTGNGTFSDVWSLSLGASPEWSPILPSGASPSYRLYHAAAFDPVRERMIVFGGFDGAFAGYTNDLWALSLAGEPAWERLTPSGTPPEARGRMGMVYDSRRDRMLVFGGSGNKALFNDTWALELSGTPAWTPIAITGAPPPVRAAFVAAYDAVRDRLVISGGENNEQLSDTWALPLHGSGRAEWIQLRDTFVPSTRSADCGVLDPVHDRLVEFSGNRFFPYGLFPSDDAWGRDLVGSAPWRELAPTGERPHPRLYPSAVYDEPAARMVVFGGLYGNIYFDDIWALDLGQGSHQAFRSQVNVLPPSSVTEVSGAALELSTRNPALHGALSVELELADRGEARIEVFTVEGRRVGSRELMLGPGRHTIALLEPGALPPGVYLVRATASGVSRTIKAAILD